MYRVRQNSTQLLPAGAAAQAALSGTTATGTIYFTMLPADTDVQRCRGVAFACLGTGGTGASYSVKGVILGANHANQWEPYGVVPATRFSGTIATSGSGWRMYEAVWDDAPTTRRIPRGLYYAAWMFNPVVNTQQFSLAASLMSHPGKAKAFADTAIAKVRYDLTSANSLVVSGCVNNGSGLCRITITPEAGASDHYIQTGMRVQTASIGGVTGANGTFLATRISATQIDLQASTFSGAYTSGGTVVRWFNYADFDTNAFSATLAAMNWPYSFATASSGTALANANLAWIEADV